MRIVKKKNKENKEKAFNDLQNVKLKHSKGVNINQYVLQMQNDLKPNILKITQSESQMIFRLLSRKTSTKTNVRRLYENVECDACEEETETQEHVVIIYKFLPLKNLKINKLVSVPLSPSQINLSFRLILFEKLGHSWHIYTA